MFDREQSGLDWAKENRFIIRCPKHKVYFDRNMDCPKCKQERKPQIFANVIWPKDSEAGQ